MFVSDYDKAFRKGYEAYENFSFDAINPYETMKSKNLSNRWLDGFAMAYANRNQRFA